jgi:hypothetical protein
MVERGLLVEIPCDEVLMEDSFIFEAAPGHLETLL